MLTGAVGDRLLDRLALAESEWREFVHFEPFKYTRSLVALDSAFSLMVQYLPSRHTSQTSVLTSAISLY